MPRSSSRLYRAHREPSEPCCLPGRGAKFWARCLLLLSGSACLFVFMMLLLSGEDWPSSSSSPFPASASPSTPPYQPPDMKQVMMWGHGGRGVKVNVSKLSEGHRGEYEKGLLKFGLNKYLSDRISMRRSLPDVRSDLCRDNQEASLSSLPGVSIIVVFRAEPRTTLLRMLYSVIDRSLQQLVREIILVDDNSWVKELQYPVLEHYLAQFKQIKILRLTTNHGYARARTLAARQAKGQVLVFLQPRVECTQNWLPPLLQALSTNRSTLVVPSVDSIDPLTFQYQTDKSVVQVGSFYWDLTLKSRSVVLSTSNLAGIANPVLANGIFAVYREEFFRLGGLDQNFKKSSSVDLELSLRSWMCGAGIELVPCCHVGLISIYEEQAGIDQDEQKVKDNVQIAESWLADYKFFVYERMKSSHWRSHLPELDPSPDSQPRSRDCRSFSWFLQVVEPDMSFTLEIDQRGQLVSVANRNMALGVKDGSPVLENLNERPGPPFWYLLKSGVLSTDTKMCLVYSESSTTPTRPLSDVLFFQKIRQSQSAFNSNQNISDPLHFTMNSSNFGVDPVLGGLKQDSAPNTLELDSVRNNPIFRDILRFRNTDNKDGRERVRQSENSAILLGTALERFKENMPELGENWKEDELRVRLDGRFDPKMMSQRAETQSEPSVVMKPCSFESEGETWRYSEVQTLQHGPSGLCLEAKSNAIGQFFLRLAQCNYNSLLQKWTFISGLVPS